MRRTGEMATVREANAAEPLRFWGGGAVQGRVVLGAAVRQACPGADDLADALSVYDGEAFAVTYRRAATSNLPSCRMLVAYRRRRRRHLPMIARQWHYEQRCRPCSQRCWQRGRNQLSAFGEAIGASICERFLQLSVSECQKMYVCGCAVKKLHQQCLGRGLIRWLCSAAARPA